MSTQESIAVPALPDRARPFRWGYFAVRLLLVAALLALAAALPGGGGDVEHARYHEGDIARDRVVAPYDFRVLKDETTLRRQQEQAAAAVPPVFVVDARVSAENLNRFALFQERALAIVLDPVLRPDARALKLRALGVPLSQESAQALAASGRARHVLRELGGWLHEIYEAGVVAEKRSGTVQGYHTIQVRDGEQEAARGVSLLYDRGEAQELIERRARAAFGGDPPACGCRASWRSRSWSPTCWPTAPRPSGGACRRRAWCRRPSAS